jgi:hypothetical protein
MEPDDTFTMPLPPPPHDVLFFRREERVQAPEREREHEDIMLRKVPNDVARRFRAAAGGRALTHAQYLAALVELHESLRKRADEGDEGARADLERLGLQSVTV